MTLRPEHRRGPSASNEQAPRRTTVCRVPNKSRAVGVWSTCKKGLAKLLPADSPRLSGLRARRRSWSRLLSRAVTRSGACLKQALSEPSALTQSPCVWYTGVKFNVKKINMFLHIMQTILNNAQ